MNITLREMGDELKKLNRIVVTGHVNPDGDAVGSALALAAILKQLGKDVQVVFNDDMPRNCRRMVKRYLPMRWLSSMHRRIELVAFWNV